jgi:predicted RNA binding protein YcfA (HicA-like mRNA interferase family)
LASLKPLPFREVKRKLEAAGFVEHSQSGSHVKFVRKTSAGVATAIVPHHREVSVGVLRSILRQAEMSVDEWESL